jgi:hypothetical protein
MILFGTNERQGFKLRSRLWGTSRLRRSRTLRRGKQADGKEKNEYPTKRA